MSQVENPTATTEIPDENVATQSTGASWRISNGMFVRGQEKEEEVIIGGDPRKVKTGRYPEEKTKIVGILKRVGIYRVEAGEYGKKYKLECDIQTKNDGIIHLGLNLLDPSGKVKVSVSALSLSWALLQYGKDEVIILETALGKESTLPDGSKGGKPTYVNPFRLQDGIGVPIRKEKRDPNAPKVSMEDQWAQFEAQLKQHPAYGERETRDEDRDDAGNPDTHREAMVDDCKRKGWPTPVEAPDAWVKIYKKAFGVDDEFVGVSDIPEDAWQALRQSLKDRTDVPKALAEWKEAQGAPAQVAMAID